MKLATRETVLKVARRLGAQQRLRTIRRALAPSSSQRNWRDDEALITLMAGVLQHDSNCIDIGAYRGSLLRHMVRLAPEGHHIAFEPNPQFSEQLARNFPNVDVRAVALSERNGRAAFTLRSDPATSNLAWPLRAGDTEIARLDDVLPHGYAPRLIKLDVEGAEYEVLEGATDTLRKHKPIIAFEHSLGCRHYGHEPGEIYELLGPAGLSVFDIDGNGPYDQSALCEEVESLEHWFFLARAW